MKYFTWTIWLESDYSRYSQNQINTTNIGIYKNEIDTESMHMWCTLAIL